MPFLNWVIIGAQTKPTVMPKIEWIQEIVEAADKAGIPVFLKDNLLKLLPVEEPFWYGLTGDEDEYLTAKLRQEMPVWSIRYTERRVRNGLSTY